MDQDLELLQRCLAGENSAWEALLRVYARKIYSVCYRFTGRAEEAEDLTQEVFIKIFQTLRSFDSKQGSFATWLHRVARNHLVDHYRRTKKDRMTESIEEDVESIAEKPSPGQVLPAMWRRRSGRSNSSGLWTAFRRTCARR